MNKRVPIWLAEAGFITVAALVGIDTAGGLMATDTYKRAELIPFVGPIIFRPLRSLVYRVYNP